MAARTVIRYQEEAIGRIQIGRPSPCATADEQLVLEQQGFGHDGAYPARAQEFGDGGQQVDGEYKQVHHR